MGWILVLRNTELKCSYIWQAGKLGKVVERAVAYRTRQTGHGWSVEADKFILKHYSPKWQHKFFPKYGQRWTQNNWEMMCGILGNILGRRVTRNMVIGRYNRLRKGANHASKEQSAIPSHVGSCAYTRRLRRRLAKGRPRVRTEGLERVEEPTKS